MVQTFTVACVQTTAGPDVKTNIINASALVREAHKSGAKLIVLPEVTNIIDIDRSAMAEKLSTLYFSNALKMIKIAVEHKMLSRRYII